MCKKIVTSLLSDMSAYVFDDSPKEATPLLLFWVVETPTVQQKMLGQSQGHHLSRLSIVSGI